MSRWPLGEADIERLIRDGELERVEGQAANGEPLLGKASQMLASARVVLPTDTDSAFVLAYDAARHAASALLMQQGLRASTRGGHYAVYKAVEAQFGSGFRDFGYMRRRRNELEYFKRTGDFATPAEAGQSIVDAETMIAAAQKLLDQLGLF
ncbi:hypothetical protein GS896_25185 [Rhodococcus hoagii]|nr:hypothetical protein [Prescottella equi]MBM4654062.1 hypothetical protein [Prescottella equi]MBM4654201.1 hypothetical protein [Prescottella equi]MBM4719675.1 hypothetical protein [Prescottella equi]NKR23472.1 hypothetical protein [Prescottella equi]